MRACTLCVFFFSAIMKPAVQGVLRLCPPRPPPLPGRARHIPLSRLGKVPWPVLK